MYSLWLCTRHTTFGGQLNANGIDNNWILCKEWTWTIFWYYIGLTLLHLFASQLWKICPLTPHPWILQLSAPPTLVEENGPSSLFQCAFFTCCSCSQAIPLVPYIPHFQLMTEISWQGNYQPWSPMLRLNFSWLCNPTIEFQCQYHWQWLWSPTTEPAKKLLQVLFQLASRRVKPCHKRLKLSMEWLESISHRIGWSRFRTVPVLGAK